LLGGVVLEVWNGLRDIISGATLFLVLVLVSRLYTKRTSNDAVQILTLSFVVVLAGSALNSSFAFAPYFALVIICSIWALTTTHLTRAAENAPDLARELRISRRFWLTTSVLAVAVFAQTTLFFVFFPRMGLGYFKPKVRTSHTTTGFSDRVELGQAGQLEDDTTVVARLELPATSELDPEQLYFRGATLSRFDGKHWMKTSHGQSPLHTRADGTFLLHKKDVARDERFRYYQEPSDGEYLFLPELTHTARLLQDNPLVAGHQRVRIYTDDSGDVTIIRPLGMAITLDAWFDPSAQSRDEDDPEALVVPATDARIAELAKAWKQDATAADDIALNLRRGFGPDYTYSTELKAPPEGTSPLAFFLFDRKAGHCEYYASALALMLRMSGVPARIVTGYKGASFNPYGKYYAVQEYRAHSWVEYRSPGRGWRRIDPTPAADPRTGEGVLEKLSAITDLMRYRWNRYVIEYDLDLQISALRSIKHTFESAPKVDQPETQSWAAWFKAYKWPFVGLVGLVAAFMFFVLRSGKSVPLDAEASRLFRRFERVMERRGHDPRPLHQPPKIYFSRVASTDPPAAPATVRFADAYLRARFSGEVSEEDVVIMRAMLQDVSQLSRRPPPGPPPGDAGRASG
jgi:transglutaminase-like putative cysteine protease